MKNETVLFAPESCIEEKHAFSSRGANVVGVVTIWETKFDILVINRGTGCLCYTIELSNDEKNSTPRLFTLDTVL